MRNKELIPLTSYDQEPEGMMEVEEASVKATAT